MVEKALDALPKGSKALDLAYDGAMQRVDSQLEGYRHLAKQLLGWLTYSERLMSVQEIQHALAIEPGESSLDEDNLSDVIEIVGYCAGLVIVEEDTLSLRLVHYTTQEYFRQNSGKHLVAAQQDIAMSCLTYLLYEEFGDGWVYEVEGQDDGHDADSYPSERVARIRLQKRPFLEYAARHWASHASVCEQQAIKELTMAFASDNHKVSSAGQAILIMEGKSRLGRDNESTKSRSPLTVMHILAYIGNKAIFSELLNYGFEPDTEDSFHRTPLWWAAEGDHYGMVEFLLSEHRVNVNNRGFTHKLWPFGNPPMVSPLHVAAQHGRTSIMKLLLGRADIDVNLRDSIGYTPLNRAVKYNHTSIVELLLNCVDIDVNLGEECGDTPLHTAVNHNHTSIVKLLLNCANIDVKKRYEDGETPLHRAASYNCNSIVKLLLNYADIDVNSRDRFGDTPLHAAAINGYTSTLKLFCAHPKIDLDSRDKWGGNVISRMKTYQETKEDCETDEEYEKRRLKLEEFLDIIRTAIEERKLKSSAQPAEQSSQP